MKTFKVRSKSLSHFQIFTYIRFPGLALIIERVNLVFAIVCSCYTLITYITVK